MRPPSRQAFLTAVAAFAFTACAPRPSIESPTDLPAPVLIVMAMTGTPTSTFEPPAATPVPTDTLTPTVIPSPTQTPTVPPPVVSPPPALPPPTAVPPTAVMPPAIVGDGSVDSAERLVVEMTNAYRAAAGLAPLVADPALMAVARQRATDMALRGYFGHTDPVTGAHLARDMAAAAGFTGVAGENIYWSGRSLSQLPEVSMTWFMSDPSHAANILHGSYASVGVGIAPGASGSWILSLVFATP